MTTPTPTLADYKYLATRVKEMQEINRVCASSRAGGLLTNHWSALNMLLKSIRADVAQAIGEKEIDAL